MSENKTLLFVETFLRDQRPWQLLRNVKSYRQPDTKCQLVELNWPSLDQ